MKSFTVEIDDDTYFFLEFLERTRFIKNKDEVVKKALIMFKDLSMHDWLPNLYRIGSSRVVLIETGMLLDIFELLTGDEIYRAGGLTALKRKVMKPEFRDIDLTKQRNWLIVLKELEKLGWGVFSVVGNEIKVQQCAVPTNYLRGYLEVLFKVELVEHQTKVEDLVIFIPGQPKLETWR